MFRLLFATIPAISLLAVMSITSGCASNDAPLPTPDTVDLDRFMGPWYVLGYTPILVDKEAHNAVEHYHLAEDGDIETTYEFRDGGFDADLKTFTPTGTVYDQRTNAEWRMQFIWPFKAEYVIMYVSEDYEQTIVGHPSRKYAWIMQRSPEISDADYEALVKRIEDAGFDREVLRRMPHDWSGESERLERIRKAGKSMPLAAVE